MKVLFLASEVAPFSKTGGLADVAGSLPAALAALGHEVKVVTPLYAPVKDPRVKDTGARLRLRFPYGEEQVGVASLKLSERHEVLFLDHPASYRRGGVYGDAHGEFGDNHRRFALLSIGALQAAQALRFTPDIVHLNDWQTGLAAVALRRGFAGTELAKAKSVFTVHNLAYQGLFPKRVMEDLGLPWDLFTPEGIEFHDAVNFMKAGLVFSDALTTVSRRYAEEIQTPELGCELDGLLRTRSDRLTGIVNGVDEDEWNPQTDRLIAATYSPDDLSGKARCKQALLERVGLPATSAPVFGVVSRLAGQKGIDLLLGALYRLLDRDLRVVVLGSGEERFERGLAELERRAPDKVRAVLKFDNALAHQIEAGADFFLMPSRYEPCGLNQLYSLRYGTPPIVHATGGLDDTVVDLSQPGGTGFKFHDFHEGALAHAIHRALELYPDRELLDAVRRQGMRQDFSWKRSAREYESLYRALVAGH